MAMVMRPSRPRRRAKALFLLVAVKCRRKLLPLVRMRRKMRSQKGLPRRTKLLLEEIRIVAASDPVQEPVRIYGHS